MNTDSLSWKLYRVMLLFNLAGEPVNQQQAMNVVLFYQHNFGGDLLEACDKLIENQSLILEQRHEFRNRA